MKKRRSQFPPRTRILYRWCVQLAQKLRKRGSKVLAQIIFRLQKNQAAAQARGYLGPMTIYRGGLEERGVSRQQLKDGLALLQKKGLIRYAGQADRKGRPCGSARYFCQALLACLRTPELTLPAPVGSHFGQPLEVRIHEAAQREALLEEQIRDADAQQAQDQVDADLDHVLDAETEAYLEQVSAAVFDAEAREATMTDRACRRHWAQNWQPQAEFTEGDLELAILLDRFDAAQEAELVHVLGIPGH